MISFDKTSLKEAAILAALDGRELYGLEIPKAVENVSGGKIKIRLGMIYPVLHNLESKGLIKGRWGEEVDPSRSGARRYYYSLTTNGGIALRSSHADDLNDQGWQFA